MLLLLRVLLSLQRVCRLPSEGATSLAAQNHQQERQVIQETAIAGDSLLCGCAICCTSARTRLAPKRKLLLLLLLLRC